MNEKDLEKVMKEVALLPELVEDVNGNLVEVVTCSSISGKADYIGNMPRKLRLVRKLKNGEEYTAEYKQTPYLSRVKNERNNGDK